MRMFTRIKFRRSGRHGLTAPPLPPTGDRCKAVKANGTRCKLEAGPTGFCEVFHRATPAGPRPA
jgi:Family of unknown function (DUF5763)